jgi:hypothetical protein
MAEMVRSGRSFGTVAMLLVGLMVSSSILGLVSISTGTIDINHAWSYTGLHIDLNIYDDATSWYDHITKKDGRVIRLNDEKTNGIAVSFEKGDKTLTMGHPDIRAKSGGLSSDTYLFGKASASSHKMREPDGTSLVTSSVTEYYTIKHTATITGLKETIVFTQPPMNLKSDLIISTIIDLGKDMKPDNLSKETWSNMSFSDRYLMDGNELALTMPAPVLYSSPSTVMTLDGPIKIKDTIHREVLSHRCYWDSDFIVYEVTIPKEIFSKGLIYPIYVDPSIVSLDGYAEYEGY